MPRHIVCLTFDFDTQSGFIARGMTTPTALSRGEFGLIGARRILSLLKACGLRATWFIPGFTIESHPASCAEVVRDGHEVAHHSWAHVPPAQQSRAEEEAEAAMTPGLVHATVAVLENVRLARDTYRVRLHCPALARAIRPGQFLMLRLPGSTECEVLYSATV